MQTLPENGRLHKRDPAGEQEGQGPSHGLSWDTPVYSIAEGESSNTQKCRSPESATIGLQRRPSIFPRCGRIRLIYGQLGATDRRHPATPVVGERGRGDGRHDCPRVIINLTGHRSTEILRRYIRGGLSSGTTPPPVWGCR